jgi:hypothetical protein
VCILCWTKPLAELFLNDLVVDKVSAQLAISKPLDLKEALDLKAASSHGLLAWAMIDPEVVRGVGW